jgi:5'(3')-deoxyribonucleotidase
MDNVIVDFQSGIDKLSDKEQVKYEDRLDDVPGIFSLMDPVENAIASVEKLSKVFDTYLLSTAPWDNPSAWSDKVIWVKKYLGEVAFKRLILSHHKNLNKGDYLIDDRLKNGASDFGGEHIHFGQDQFKNWNIVTEYLISKS